MGSAKKAAIRLGRLVANASLSCPMYWSLAMHWPAGSKKSCFPHYIITLSSPPSYHQWKKWSIHHNKIISQSGINKVILFYSILFYSILFYHNWYESPFKGGKLIKRKRLCLTFGIKSYLSYSDDFQENTHTFCKWTVVKTTCNLLMHGPFSYPGLYRNMN